jgi:uncharacterized membrane protein YfcA
MAVAMAAGSYVAGSTPMGGGTVGFPVLVLLMDLPATLGRDFSFAIQSVGMTSASIYILCKRQELEWPMLRAALLGALVGTPLGILYIAPLASDLFIKLLFAILNYAKVTDDPMEGEWVMEVDWVRHEYQD